MNLATLELSWTRLKKLKKKTFAPNIIRNASFSALNVPRVYVTNV